MPRKKKNKVDKQLQQLTDIRRLVLTSIITALSLVVGLFWKDVVTEAISKIVPPGDTLLYKFAAAMIATVAVVAFVYLLVHTHRLAGRRLREFQKSQDRFVKNYKKRLR